MEAKKYYEVVGYGSVNVGATFEKAIAPFSDMIEEDEDSVSVSSFDCVEVGVRV